MAIEFPKFEPKWPPDPEVQDQTRRGRQIRETREFRPIAADRSSVAQSSFADRIAGEFRRADLANPEKLDRMVRSSVREMVASNTSVAAAMTEAQKEYVAEFLSGDPAVRKGVEQYLGKVLK